MANDKFIYLRHLALSAMRCSAMVTGKIAELTTAISQDLAELDDAKQDKISGTTGQFVGFDSENNPVAMDAATSDDAIDLLTESGFITPAYAGSNTFYTDNNGVIYTI